MKMKMVVAIARTTSLEHIVQALEKIGIRSMTISQIKGIGEQVMLNTPLQHTRQNRDYRPR